MRLEDEIKQKKFSNEYHKAVVNIIYSCNWINTIHNSFLKPRHITYQQYNVLRILRGQHPNPSTVRLLIDRMLDKMSNASRLVEKLRVKGYVSRSESPSDRRAVDVMITEKGLELLKALDKEVEEGISKINTISAGEAEELNRILDKMRG